MDQASITSVRISRARELLEFWRSTVDEVATAIGYEDDRGFRRVFQNIVGLPPSDYVAAFPAADRSRSKSMLALCSRHRKAA
jgi:transcriptional regulator GlxA family with amidase domain